MSCCVISGCVLVCFPVATINTMTKSILWRKGFMSTCTSRSQSISERSQDRNSSRSSGGMMLTAPSGSCLTDFIIQPRPACLGIVLPTVGGALSHRSLAEGQPAGGNSPVEALPPQGTLCCQVCNKITSTGLDDKKSPHMFSKTK